MVQPQEDSVSLDVSDMFVSNNQGCNEQIKSKLSVKDATRNRKH